MNEYIASWKAKDYILDQLYIVGASPVPQQ